VPAAVRRLLPEACLQCADDYRRISVTAVVCTMAPLVAVTAIV
jgi:hypothetical protein